MFWKKKEIQKEKQEIETETKKDYLYCEIPILKRKTRYAKTIIENKLYDTEKAEIISPTEDHRILFVTKREIIFLARQQVAIIRSVKKVKHITFLKLSTMT